MDIAEFGTIRDDSADDSEAFVKALKKADDLDMRGRFAESSMTVFLGIIAR